MKTCIQCLTEKPVSEFGRNSRYADGLHRKCLVCANAQARANYWRKPEKYRAAKRKRSPVTPYDPPASRARHLRQNYGLTLEDFDMFLRLQEGACKICGEPGTVVDHDHLTGEYRGILCQRCNRGLGHFKDNPMMLQKAIDYLLECAMMAADANAVR